VVFMVIHATALGTTVQRFSITLLSLNGPKLLSWMRSQKRARPIVRFAAKFCLAKYYNLVMIVLSSKEVRAAASYRGCNEVDEMDRPQPGGAGCGHCSTRPA